MNTAFDPLNSYTEDWLFYDFVVDAQLHIRLQNGESTQSYPCHVLRENQANGDYRQIAEGLNTNPDAARWIYWRDKVEHPAPATDAVIEIVIGENEIQSWLIQSVVEDRLGKWVMETVRVREDVLV